MGGLTLSSATKMICGDGCVPFIYMRKTQHLQFTVVSPLNEPDITDTGVHLSASPVRHVLHDLCSNSTPTA